MQIKIKICNSGLFHTPDLYFRTFSYTGLFKSGLFHFRTFSYMVFSIYGFFHIRTFSFTCPKRLLITEQAFNRSIVDFLGFAAHVEEAELEPLLPTVEPAAVWLEIGEAVQDSKVLSLFH